GGSTSFYNSLVQDLAELHASTHPISKKPKRDVRGVSLKLRSLLDVAQSEHDKDNTLTTKVTRSCKYTLHPVLQQQQHRYMSQLQHRHTMFCQYGTKTGLSSLPDRVRRYYLFLSLEQQEDRDNEFGLSMVGDTCWTPSEKSRFFCALERCGKDIQAISQRVGPTKTVVQVAAYLDMLDMAAKKSDPVEINEAYSAREMSPLFILQENIMASTLEQLLETESHAKHQSLLSDPPTILENALDVMEVWNMSSLTRLFGGINDMTVLASTVVQLHELLQRFVSDIIMSLHTELVNSTDKTVSRSLMNRTIAKQQKEGDVRLKEMDIVSLLDGREHFHHYYTANKSASFLAKRRRKAWLVADQQQQQQQQQEEEEEEEDSMLQPFDYEDELPGYMCIVQNEEIDKPVELDTEENDDDDDDDDDTQLEDNMLTLDQINEQTLLKSLGFFDIDTIAQHAK
ncbi:hypothetical protein CU098_000327, partial [Rhizopus stolonifer]